VILKGLLLLYRTGCRLGFFSFFFFPFPFRRQGAYIVTPPSPFPPFFFFSRYSPSLKCLFSFFLTLVAAELIRVRRFFSSFDVGSGFFPFFFPFFPLSFPYVVPVTGSGQIILPAFFCFSCPVTIDWPNSGLFSFFFFFSLLRFPLMLTL